MTWLTILLIYCIAVECNQMQDKGASKKEKTNEIHTIRNASISNCNPDEFEFGNHCYFTKEHKINGMWNLSNAMSVCHNHDFGTRHTLSATQLCKSAPSARGVAVETDEELNFIKDKLMSIHGDQWKALTSGYLTCWPKSNLTLPDNFTYCGSWYEWDTFINHTVLGFNSCSQYGFTDSCGPEGNIGNVFTSHYVLRKDQGQIIWDVWIPYFASSNLWSDESINERNFFSPPTHIVCEYEILNGSSCSANTTKTGSTQTTSIMNHGSTAEGNSSTRQSEAEEADFISTNTTDDYCSTDSTTAEASSTDSYFTSEQTPTGTQASYSTPKWTNTEPPTTETTTDEPTTTGMTTNSTQASKSTTKGTTPDPSTTEPPTNEPPTNGTTTAEPTTTGMTTNSTQASKSTTKGTTPDPSTTEPPTNEPPTNGTTTAEPTTTGMTTNSTQASKSTTKGTTPDPSTTEPPTNEPPTNGTTTAEPTTTGMTTNSTQASKSTTKGTTPEPSTTEPPTNEPPTNGTTTAEAPTAEPTTDSTQGSSTTENSCRLCRQEDEYGHPWKACAGKKAFSSCPLGAAGKCSWECSMSGSSFIGKTPDYSKCHNDWMDSLVNSNSSASDIADEFQKNTNNGTYYGHEIIHIINALDNLTELFHQQLTVNGTADSMEQECKNFISTMGSVTNNLIRDSHQWDQLSDVDQATTGIKIQELLQTLGMTISNLLVHYSTVNMPKFEFPFSSIYIGVDLTMASHKTKLSFPMEGPRDNGSIAVFGASKDPGKNLIISGMGNIIPSDRGKQIFPENFKSWSYAKTILNSAVVSYSYKIMSDESGRRHYHKVRKDDSPLTIESVEVILTHSTPARGPESGTIKRKLYDGEERTAVLGSSKCVFWNKNIGVSGEWDTTGCKVGSTNETHTKCVCTHLSSFAVFMSLHEYKDKGFTMDLLTWICSGSSIISLVITLLIFHFFRQKLSGERETICRNISACLLITHVLTLSVLDKTYFNMPDPLCSFMGAALHYILSASIMWMAAEGHYLYRSILHVMDATGRDRRNLYRIISYGLPAAFVAATALIGLALGENAYGNPEICWLSLPHYQWVFIVQTLIMTGANTLVLILALRATMSATPIRDKSKRRKIWIWIRGWFTLSSLLGVSWFIGLLSFDSNVFMEYMFVVFNGSQGVLIFMTRVLRNRQVKKIVLNMVKNHKSLRGLGFKATMVTGNSTSAEGLTNSTRASQSFSDQILSSTNESTASYFIPDPPEKGEDGSLTILAQNPDYGINLKKDSSHQSIRSNCVTDPVEPSSEERQRRSSMPCEKSNLQHEGETVNTNPMFRVDSMKVTYSRKEIHNGAQQMEFLTELKAHLIKYRARLRPLEENSSSERKEI